MSLNSEDCMMMDISIVPTGCAKNDNVKEIPNIISAKTNDDDDERAWNDTDEFRQNVVSFAETYGTRAAAHCYKLDKQIVKEWQKKEKTKHGGANDQSSLKVKLVGDYSLRKGKALDFKDMEDSNSGDDELSHSDMKDSNSGDDGCSTRPARNMTKGFVHRSFSVLHKLKVIEYSKTHNNSVTASHFNVSRKQIREWKKKEDVLRANIDHPNAKRIVVADDITKKKSVERSISESDEDTKVLNLKQPSSASHKGQRIETYTIDFKLKVVDFAKNHSISITANTYCVDRKQVRYWKKQEDKLRDIEDPKSSTSLGGKGRKIGFPVIDAELYNWLREQQKIGIKVTNKVMKTKALQLHMEKGSPQFKATGGWLRSFSRRHDVAFPNAGKPGRPIGTPNKLKL